MYLLYMASIVWKCHSFWNVKKECIAVHNDVIFIIPMISFLGDKKVIGSCQHYMRYTGRQVGRHVWWDTKSWKSYAKTVRIYLSLRCLEVSDLPLWGFRIWKKIIFKAKIIFKKIIQVLKHRKIVFFWYDVNTKKFF